MKAATKFIALLAVVICFAACNKEEFRHERDITYSVAENTTTVHLSTEAEWDALLKQFCDYAKSGSSVTFYNVKKSQSKDSRKYSSPKETVTYSTTSREEMKAWMARMEDAGKTVTVTYDPSTGTWNGAAYATAPPPQNDSTQWVDLGLPSGLLWARCNIGASAPEEYGDYFAWGETHPKGSYNWETYIHCNGQYRLTKYNNWAPWGDNGYTDTLTTLEPCDDAATVNLCGGARIPTKEEWKELIDNTSLERITINGVYCYKFTATNGDSLLLPQGGSYCGPVLNIGPGFYWSSTLDTTLTIEAWSFSVMEVPCMLSVDRNSGYTVRSVRATSNQH